MQAVSCLQFNNIIIYLLWFLGYLKWTGYKY